MSWERRPHDAGQLEAGRWLLTPTELDQRRAALHDLIRGESLEQAIGQIRSFPHDCPVELVQLDAGDIARAMKRYHDGTWTAKDVEEWANALEGREDVAMTQEIIEALFVLANPTLHGTLTLTQATALSDQLRKAQPGT